MDTGKDVLFFPPFAEELNKSRRMIALQADALSQAGYGVLLPDLFGTGDSEGDFADGRWELWLQDAATALNWLISRGRSRIIFWGLRLGALLAMNAVSRREAVPLKVMLWHPVCQGEPYLTQFLRLRLAADMLTGGEEAPTTGSLRQELREGRQVEIAGYTLHPSLAAAIDELKLSAFRPPEGVSVEWLEIISAPDRPIGHASWQIIERWRQEGVNVEVSTMVGESFWNTPEITQVPGLIDITLQRAMA